MTPARFQTIEEIFHSALEQVPEELDHFLASACEGDQALRAEVEKILRSSLRAGSFIETSALGLATRILETASPDSLIGQRIGHYELKERIGAGGMGDVYLATDLTAGRKAALKFLPWRFAGHPGRLKRFAQEARAVVALNHPNILTVYEIGEERAAHYIASELVDGETLRQRLARGAIPMEEALEIAIQVASALAAAHAAEIVHRDIKPENIMLRPDGYVKVLDFGIAKLAERELSAARTEEDAEAFRETRATSIAGTARYMSPEQARGSAVDRRTDIWSLGLVIYEMLSGAAPFGGENAKEVMTAILQAEPPPLTGCPDGLERIMRKTLRKEPNERYANAHELIEALKKVRRRLELTAESEVLETTPARRHWRRWAAALLLLLLTATVVICFYWTALVRPTSPPPIKSIAVLPFQDLGDNKEHAEFAAGIQDDVLTSLAQIHELKVVSRTSVMAYQKPNGRNMRAISRALGVANVLEGSVRRVGNRVLVNVQLIDAGTDRHLWVQSYDRTVADSIGLQGELATQIAVALKATLAPEEKARLSVGPTANSEAYVLYLTALGKQDDKAAEQLCVQATVLDPKFALAYARASLLNSEIAAIEESRARRARARAQAEESLRLSPILGEAHMALGLCLYLGDRKFDAALKEFEVAAAASPNNAEIYTYIGGIHRRQGRWREAVANFDRALSLDPRNTHVLLRAANNHLFMRDWAGAVAGYSQELKFSPDSVMAHVALAYLELCRNSNPAAGRRILQNIPPSQTALTRWNLAMLERDYASAEQALSNLLPDDPVWGYSSKEFYSGRTALARGDLESAQRYFATARPVFENRVREDPDDSRRHAELGLLYACMQRKEDAIRESRRALELDFESQDAFHGALQAANLALVHALVGDQEHAITLLERLLSTPGAVSFPACQQSVTLAELRLGSQWDSLRSNPRFQKILAAPEPKTIY